MSDIIRMEEEIKALIRALEKELETMPDRNIWGESTAESNLETRTWVKELKTAAEHGTVLEPWSEVGYWLLNEKSTLTRDYGIE